MYDEVNALQNRQSEIYCALIKFESDSKQFQELLKTYNLIESEIEALTKSLNETINFV